LVIFLLVGALAFTKKRVTRLEGFGAIRKIILNRTRRIYHTSS